MKFKYGQAAARKTAGFTLIEVMIAVVVVSILTAVALPSYREYVRRAQRVDAMNVMMQAANWMQQNYTLNNKYPAGSLPASMQYAPSGSTAATAKYSIANVAPADTTYKLQASPVNGTSDPKCNKLILDNAGAKTIDATDTTKAAECWNGK